MKKETKERQKYLLEDQDLIEELESIGSVSTGTALEEQKRKILVVEIKAILKSRKSTKDAEIANIQYSNAILFFAGIQVLLALTQVLQFMLGNTVKYFNPLALIVLCVFNIFLQRIKEIQQVVINANQKILTT